MEAQADSGSIESGKQADMVLLSENPLLNINAIRKLSMVILGDRYFEPARLHDAIGIRPFVTIDTVETGTD